MLYVLLDSNIWYYLIDAHHDGKEHFRKLKYWVKDEKVKLLVPQTIVDEWARGETKKYKELEASWKRFFSRAKVFFDVSSLNTPEKVKTLIENQLEDIREIFAHHSVIIPITDAVRIDAANMAVENKRPFGRKKNSMADAFIYLSFVDYLERNGIVGNCYFVSENHSDFSDERDKEVIHPDLKPKFDERGVTYVHKMDYAFHQLSERLPNLESYEQADRFEQEKSKLENALLSPGFFDDIDGVADSHLSGISLLDSAISKPNPSKAEITTSISLIQSNENYKDYFLQKIHHAIWFKILDKIGLFDYQHNPDRILTSSGGYQVPRWSSILYLEKLSEKIANGEEQQLVPNIIRIIEDLSTHPKDNFFTWYKVIGIVANLPASAVSMKLLDFIPVWFTTTDHDTLFQSSELCRKLLPKYLLDSSESEESKNKALKILEHVFKVTEKADFSAELENGKYRFPIHLSELKMALFDNNLISEVKRIQSGNLVLTIADSLEKVITRLPIRFEKEFSEPIKSLTISATKADMSVSVVSEGAVVFNHTLPNYYHLGEVQVARYLFDIILKEIKEVNPEELNAYIAEKVSYIFNYSTKLWIEDLSEVDRNGHFHSIGELLTGILVELLANPPKQRQTEYVSILSDFLNYKISYPPIIRRLALHAIRNNWSTIGEEVFLDLLRTENIQPFLIIYEYHREVFELLSKCSGDLLEPDKAIFQSIIERGPKSAKRAYSEQDIDIWKLRWYTALREDSFFQGSYSILSKKYGLSSDYFQPSPKVTIRSGDTSPFSSGELLSMDSAEIVSRIHAFIPKSSWDEPTVGGFATALQDAVSEEPQRFAAELSLFTDIPYLYSYHLVYGFMKAVKAQKEFDVNNVLSFCSQYISNLEDRKEALTIEYDSWKADHRWVIGTMGEFISEVSRSQIQLIGHELKEIEAILFALISLLEKKDDYNESSLEAVNYSANSTAGKVLRAVLEYSLLNARLQKTEDDVKWRITTRELYDETLKKEIHDSFILLGWFMWNFIYLDRDWTLKHVQRFYDLTDEYWNGFIGGILFTKPIRDEAIHKILKPHYQRLINTELRANDRSLKGLPRHLAAQFFWGLEEFEEDSLLILFLKRGPIQLIADFIRYIGIQVKYVESLKEADEKAGFRAKIESLWRYILNEYGGPEAPEALELQACLPELLRLFDNVNETLVELTTASLSNYNKATTFYARSLYDSLVRFKNNATSEKEASLIYQIIISSAPTSSRLLYPSKQQTEELLTYLFESGLIEEANNICDILFKNGFEFVNTIFRKYNK